MRHEDLKIAVLLAALAVGSAAAGAAAQAPAPAPLTRAERTEYRETSRYADVVAFVQSLAADARLHPTVFGYSFEGRPLPLVVAGQGLPDPTPAAVRSTGRLRVLVFANIHAGEVEGKEATQSLLRAIANGERDRWLESMVLLVVPILNADGNERVSVTNRARQHGPEGGVGTRANAQDLDLNRDHMKLVSPEARALVGVMSDYDPHVIVDLHSTNGTLHAYHLTYSPPLHPGTDPAIVDLLRDRWFPDVTRRVLEERGWHFYYYGNAYAPPGRERGWYTFDHRPRFSTNYAGLRNRFGILSEAYAYLDLRGRVEATEVFVDAVLDYAHRHADAIVAAVSRADSRPVVGERLPVQADFNRDGEVEILMGAAEERLSRASGRRHLARLDTVRAERMPEFGTFRATETERVPESYYLPPGLDRVVDLLAFHGITVERLDAPVTRTVERFAIDSTRVAPREFQGHREREVFGHWEGVEQELPRGTARVRLTDQPLARLTFVLLEPRSDDGALNWNYLDTALDAEPRYYPILRAAPSR
jgi:hypothetical protein